MISENPVGDRLAILVVNIKSHRNVHRRGPDNCIRERNSFAGFIHRFAVVVLRMISVLARVIVPSRLDDGINTHPPINPLSPVEYIQDHCVEALRLKLAPIISES
jgi:hypothetical protein